MSHFAKSEKTDLECLLAGLGIRDSERADLLAVTALNHTPPNTDRGPHQIQRENQARLKRPSYVSGDQIAVDAFTFDMMRRAASISDGNAFFQAYNPDIAAKSRKQANHDDMSLQYSEEATNAIAALEGLNIVPDDLLRAAMMGKSSDRLEPAGLGPKEQKSLEALRRLVLRLLCDTDDHKHARQRMTNFLAMLTSDANTLLAEDPHSAK
jgi:hypothetical protein